MKHSLKTLPLLFFFSLLALPLQAQLQPFSEEAQSRGLNYILQAGPQSFGHLGFGCGFADLDNDTDPDIIILGAADGRVGIFENDGSANFTDRSLGNGIPLITQATGFNAFDYDGDGDLDLYLTQIAEPNVLVRNDGNFQFTPVSVIAGVTDRGSGESASAADYDGDGDLDLYVCNYNGLVEGTEDFNNVLYQNQGDGTFEDVAADLGVDDFGYTFQSVWFDYDRDGDVDLYISNDRAPLPPLYRENQLWRNDGGTFVNVSEESGADIAIYSMGVACGDFDGNGYPDLYCTNIEFYEEGFNPLLLNQGDGTFLESSHAAGVEEYITAWGAIFFDFDNDTHMDLYVNNMFEPNGLFDCNGTFPCSERAAEANVTASTGASFSSAIADVDADGDLDLLVNNLGGNVELFINHHEQVNNWVRFRVRGIQKNLSAVGASVNARIGSTWYFREILAGGNGYLGQNEFEIHFGLGSATQLDEAHVQWPGGAPLRILSHLPAGSTWTIFPPDSLGDFNADGAVLLNDYLDFRDCFGLPFAPGCEVFDFSGDFQLAADDVEGFFERYTGNGGDCDTNGALDLKELLLNNALDADENLVLDSCEAVDPCSLGLDSDGDSVSDCDDLCPNDPTKFAPGLCGCATPDIDTNENGIVDCYIFQDASVELGSFRQQIKRFRALTQNPTRRQKRRYRLRKRALRASIDLLYQSALESPYSGFQTLSGIDFIEDMASLRNLSRRLSKTRRRAFQKRKRNVLQALGSLIEGLIPIIPAEPG